MNSFRFIERGINAEIARQDGDRCAPAAQVEQETLHFDPRTERDHVAALQGGGARLPLLPRARPRRRSRSPRRCSSAPRAALPELPAARAERFERELGPERRHRAAARVPHRAGRLLRGGARRPTAPTRSRVANWIANELRRAARGRRRPGASRRSTPAALAALVAHGRAPSRSRRARPRRCSTSSSPTAATPRAIVEAEGLGAIGGGDELDADRRGRARRQPRRRREAARRQHEADRRRSSATSCARPRAAPTAARSRRLVREQLGL